MFEEELDVIDVVVGTTGGVNVIWGLDDVDELEYSYIIWDWFQTWNKNCPTMGNLTNIALVFT